MRDGCFCAHPLMLHLLQVPDSDAEQIRADLLCCGRAQIPGAVRLSTGLTTTTDDLDVAVEALLELASRGPQSTYRHDPATGHYTPTCDARQLPDLACLKGTTWH